MLGRKERIQREGVYVVYFYILVYNPAVAIQLQFFNSWLYSAAADAKLFE